MRISAIHRCLWALLCAAGIARAQFSSSIQGRITDSSNAVVPEAIVTVTNVETGIERTVKSSADGLYRVLSLGPGQYRVIVHRTGFMDSSRGPVRLGTGETLPIDFTLRASAVAEKVTVSAERPLVETEEGRVSGHISQTELKEMPLNGNNLFNLLALEPGITGRQRSVASGGGGRPGNDPFSGEASPQVYASGQRNESNSFAMDGSSIDSGVRGGYTNITPSAETVQELRVVANNFSAVDGRNSGARVEVITKSGSNRFHGGATYYFQNNTLSARNEFESRVAVFRKNQFGYTVGGPIVHNRTFFFTSYEGLRQSGGRGQVVTLETSAFRDFVIQTRPNSIAAKLLNDFKPAVYPTFNFSNVSGIPAIGSASFTPPTVHNGNQFQVRIDHEPRPGTDRLYGSYYLNNGYSLDANVRPGFTRPFHERSQFADINETHIFSPAKLNEFRIGVIRLRGGNDAPQHLEVPNISITGISSAFPMGQFPNGWWQTNWTAKDVFSWMHASHLFKMGGEYRRDFENAANTSNYIPSYSFASLLDFANDNPLQMQRSVDPRTGYPATSYQGVRTREWSLFFNDDWKATRRLSLTLGLRYEHFGSMTDSKGQLTNLILGPGTNYFERLASARVDFVGQLYPPENTDLAPRFALAWDPLGNGRTSIRTGYGLAYDRIFTLRAASYASNPPLVATATLGQQFGTTFTYTLGDVSKPNFGYPIDPGLQLGLDDRNGIKGARVAISAVAPNLSTPYVHNWFLGVQRELPGHVVAEMNYLGSAGHHLLATFNINRYAGDLLIDGKFKGINPSFGAIRTIRSESNSIYHGGSLRIRRDFRRGFLVQGVYTFGKAMGDVDDGGATENYQDANNRRIDRSVLSFDTPQQLSILGVWEMPFLKENPHAVLRAFGGWRLSGSAVLQKGLPINIVNNASWPRGDFNADGTGLDRPNIPGQGVRTSGWSRSDYLNGIFRVSDFPTPARGTDGNLGRNAFRGPGFAETDLSLAKQFAITERFTMQLRGDAFNALNRVNLNNPVSDLSNNNFGRSTGADIPRVFQLGLRMEF